MAATTEPGERDKAEEVAEMQALSRGVEAAVNLELLLLPRSCRGRTECLGGGSLHEPALPENVHYSAPDGRGCGVC